ncbi:hypothetical protein EVAR_92874_1 [Eumeta japonica]|uniref:Uncharacterized protein n=1 Tax=Eumeta variegata TaxID=151549 RepID=A0A4C1TD15_EUMVA|nr:hypothetical protein EVAR_92874_1 [Eumeta japonica]
MPPLSPKPAQHVFKVSRSTCSLRARIRWLCARECSLRVLISVGTVSSDLADNKAPYRWTLRSYKNSEGGGPPHASPRVRAARDHRWCLYIDKLTRFSCCKTVSVPIPLPMTGMSKIRVIRIRTNTLKTKAHRRLITALATNVSPSEPPAVRGLPRSFFSPLLSPGITNVLLEA